MSLIAPLVLLASAAKPPPLSSSAKGIGRLNGIGFTVAIGIALLSASGQLYSITMYPSSSTCEPLYASHNEIAAWHWINDSLKTDGVVLASSLDASRLAKYTGVTVANGNYAATPNFYGVDAIIKSILSAPKVTERERSYFRDLRASHVYCGPQAKQICALPLDDKTQFSLIYRNPEVSLYSILP